MPKRNSILWSSALLAVLVAGPSPARATGPVGLEAIERFELLSSLRGGARTYPVFQP